MSLLINIWVILTSNRLFIFYKMAILSQNFDLFKFLKESKLEFFKFLTLSQNSFFIFWIVAFYPEFSMVFSKKSHSPQNSNIFLSSKFRLWSQIISHFYTETPPQPWRLADSPPVKLSLKQAASAVSPSTVVFYTVNWWSRVKRSVPGRTCNTTAGGQSLL